MNPDTLAMLKLNIAHVPMSDEERADLIRWLVQLATEFSAGEHWGRSVFARELPR